MGLSVRKDPIDKVKSCCYTTTPNLMLQTSSKRPSKSSIGRFFNAHLILRILRPRSIYHIFRSLSNQMRGVTFDNDEHLENWLNNFFESSSGDFWRNGIDKLIKRWEQVVNKKKNTRGQILPNCEDSPYC